MTEKEDIFVIQWTNDEFGLSGVEYTTPDKLPLKYYKDPKVGEVLEAIKKRPDISTEHFIIEIDGDSVRVVALNAAEAFKPRLK